MNDQETTTKEIKAMVKTFVEQRNWSKFHAPKNISMALAIEAGELMEHFQWLTIDESRSVQEEPEKLKLVAEELADVFCYGFALANEMGIDIADAMEKKMEKNRLKYPIEEFKGRFGPEDDRPVDD